MKNLAFALTFGALLVLAALVALVLADAVPAVGAVPLAALETATPETIVITATPYRCANGDVLGSSSACPIAILNVGPTPTPDLYHVTALEAGGRTYQVYRGWSYADVLIISLLAVLVGIVGFYGLRRTVQG